MKKFVKTLVSASTIAPVAVGFVAADSQVDCGSSFLPAGLCNAFAGASGFTVSGILGLIFGLVIAGLVLFILFQIVKAVFDWIGKSNDDKARASAIKSITNAVVAGIVLIIALLVVVFGSKALGIGDVPALAYECYKSGASVKYDGTIASGQKANGATAYEGKGMNATKVTVPAGPNGQTDTNLATTLSEKVYCKDDKTGKEFNGTPGDTTGNKANAYVVVKKVGVQRSDGQ